MESVAFDAQQQLAQVVGLIRVMTKGGSPEQITVAENALFGLQSSPHWQQYIRIYLDLAQSTEVDVQLVAHIQLKYILKAKGEALSPAERRQCMQLYGELRNRVPSACVAAYADTMAALILKDYLTGTYQDTLAILKTVLAGIKPILVSVLEQGFQSYDLDIQLGIVVGVIEGISDEKPMLEEEQRDLLPLFYGQLAEMLLEVSKVYQEFLGRFMQGIEKVSDDNLKRISAACDTFFRIMKKICREVSDPTLLFDCFDNFITQFPTTLDRCLSRESAFETTIEILASYFTFADCSFDYIKTTYKYFCTNWTYLVDILKHQQIVGFLVKVDKADLDSQP